MEFLLVGMGGFLGAVARFSMNILERKYIQQSFPLGTLGINITGCFIAGVVVSKVESFQINRHGLLLLQVGFIGSFTTFSTLMVDSVQLLRSGHNTAAILNLLLSLTLGSSAVVIGMKAF